MKKFLIENGFELKEYPDGLFWLLFAHKQCFIQVTEDFSNICLYSDGWVENNLTYEELVSTIKQFKEMETK